MKCYSACSVAGMSRRLPIQPLETSASKMLP
jgi:hypothetical protein